MVRRQLLRRLSSMVLAAGILLGAAPGVRADTAPEPQEPARQEIPFLPETEDAKLGYYAAIEALQQSCSASGVEDGMLINMKTGEHQDIGLEATSMNATLSTSIIRRAGENPENNLMRICHCHIVFADDFRHINGTPDYVVTPQEITNNLLAHIPSEDDAQSAIFSYGTFFLDRGDAPADLDFCIVPTPRNTRFNQHQEQMIYSLPSEIEEKAVGIARNISATQDEEFTNTSSAHISAQPTEDTSFNSLSIFGETKAKEYMTAVNPRLPKDALSAIRIASNPGTLANIRDVAEQYMHIEERKIRDDDSEVFGRYLREKKEGLIPVLEAADGVQIYTPCNDEPPVYSGMTRDQIGWARSGFTFTSDPGFDLDGDGLEDKFILESVPNRVIRTCGLTSEWEDKENGWEVRFGNGSIARGYFKGPLITEVEYRGSDIWASGTDYEGTSHAKNFNPVYLAQSQ